MTPAYDRYWHLADMPVASADVRLVLVMAP
jgi:hypothetical protein